MSDPTPTFPAGIDRDNPWPGLASFTEDSREFFFGREKETDELSRLVRRQTLTVLFGQSGLGKSSLLNAGLFPLLRDSDHLPLYLRLDHAPSTPAPAEQVKTALTAAFTAAKADAPAFRADETLWEYFNRKDVDIWSAKNRLLTPVLAFDQFEEIFTLGRADDAARERSRIFLAELACLVENRAPAAVQEKLDRGELDPARFNFSKPSCQVILSLREDFLPDLEGLKQSMPALVHNRLRLKKLSGTQALEIVTKPAPHLLADGVAEKIVEFVAGARGGSAERLAELDVEPPLLSVICRELNDRRRALGQAQITADLVSGNRREILTDFYERSVADLPPGMRTFVEDHLLTKSGFRDNLALETALEFPGVTRPLLDTLVSRRLLRIEDRLGVQRVELTHDVLAEVIRSARDARMQRLELAESMRRATRQRWIIGGLATAVVALLIGAFFGVRAQRHAEQAQRDEAVRSSRTDLSYGSQLLEQGKVAEGIAYLARAARTDPMNYAAGPRLISALAYRAFALPIGLTYAHADSTFAGGFSADGARVVTGSEDRTFSIWNVATGERIVGPVKFTAELLGTAMAQTGDLFAISQADGTLRIWETATGKLVAGPLASGKSTVRIAFSPDSRWVAAGNSEGTAKIWDAHTGEVKATLQMKQWISSVDFSADSTRLLTTEFLKGWRVWAVPSGAPLTPLSMEANGQANFGRFSPDGKLVVICDMAGAQLWDWATGAKVGPRMVHDSRSDFAAFSSDGTRLITTAAGRVTKVWDVPAVTLRRKFDFSGAPSLSRDGHRLLTTAFDGAVLLVDIDTGLPVIEPIRSAVFTNAVFSRDENEIWAGARDGIVRRFRANAAAAAPLRISRPNQIARLELDASGRLALSTARQTEYLDPATGRELVKPRLESNRDAGGLTSSATSADRNFRAGINRQNEGELLDLRDPEKVVRHPLAPMQGIVRFIFSPDSTKLAQYQIDTPEVFVWDTATGKSVGEPFRVPGNFAIFVQFDRAAQRLAIGDTDGNVVVWDLATRKQLGETIPLGGQVRGIGFSPDGTRLACGGNARTVEVVEVASGRHLQPTLHLPSAANLFLFSQDGRTLTIPTQNDNRIHVWNLETGALRSVELSNERPVTAIALDRDYSRAAIVDLVEGTIRTWSVATGQLLAEPIRPVGTPRQTTLAPDGRFYGFASRPSGTAEIWPLPVAPLDRPVPDWMRRLATAIVGGDINAAGEFRAIPAKADDFSSLAAELAALPADAPYVKWGRWILADPATRGISPESPLTAAEAAQFFKVNPVSALATRALRLRQQEKRTEAEYVERQIVEAAGAVQDEETSLAADSLGLLVSTLFDDHRFVDLEPLARVCLALAERAKLSEDQLTVTRGYLGESLVALQRPAEAEPILLATHASLSRRSSAANTARAREIAALLAQVYTAIGRPEKAAEWKK